MVKPILTPAAAANIQTLRQRMFATRYLLQNPQQTITIRRKDGSATAPQQVVVQWQNRLPQMPRETTTAIVSQEGIISAWGSLDAPVGGTFVVSGKLAEIIVGVVVDRGVAKARFRITGERD